MMVVVVVEGKVKLSETVWPLFSSFAPSSGLSSQKGAPTFPESECGKQKNWACFSLFLEHSLRDVNHFWIALFVKLF